MFSGNYSSAFCLLCNSIQKHILVQNMKSETPKIIIAIDGHSSCGKSTLAKELSKALQYAYIDTGAMYRAVTLYLIQNKIALDDKEGIELALKNIKIHFENIDGQNTTFLNNENVETEIRKMYVSEMVSPVATISTIRRAMVWQQQMMSKAKGVILDGRDIGTVVFPDAELKLFVTADIATRAQRRFIELKEKGIKANLEEVAANLSERDHIDSNRADSPLKQAEDAVLIDNSNLSRAEQLAMVLALVELRKGDC